MSKIKKKEEIELPQSVIGCITGVPGIGKTTIALSAPKPLLLDTDRGVHRVQKEYRTDTVQVKKYQDVLDVLNEDLSDYETIVIDTLGELVNFMLKYFIELDKSLITRGGTYNIRIWGLIKTEFQNLKMKLQDLNKNLIFVAHTTEDKDGGQKIYRIDVAGSTAKDIIKILDFLGFCEMIGETRSISFSPSVRFYAKNSIQLVDYIEIPTLKDGMANTFLTDEVIEPTKQRRLEESQELQEIEKQLADCRYLIHEALEPNAVLTAFKTMKLSDANKIILFNELKQKFADYEFSKGEFVKCAVTK